MLERHVRDARLAFEGEIRGRLDRSAGDHEVADAEELVGAPRGERHQRILEELHHARRVLRPRIVDDEAAIEAGRHRDAVGGDDLVVPLGDRAALLDLGAARGVDAILFEADVPAHETACIHISVERLLERLPRQALDEAGQSEARPSVGPALEFPRIDRVSVDDVLPKDARAGCAELAGGGHAPTRARRPGRAAVRPFASRTTWPATRVAM